MNRLIRLIRHRWHDDTAVRRVLGAEGRQRIETRVSALERGISGELRVCVEGGLPIGYVWRAATARERAVAMFGKLRVWDTEHNNGVLIYLLLAERQLEIVADRGIARWVPALVWQEISESMANEFQSGRYTEGILGALDKVGALMGEHFPIGADSLNPNELPDTPAIL
jgi:uncharacterized membrane protein YgcG